MLGVETQRISIFDFANVIGKIKEDKVEPPKEPETKKDVREAKKEEKGKTSTI